MADIPTWCDEESYAEGYKVGYADKLSEPSEFKEIQTEQKEWALRNFGEVTVLHVLLGAGEELGELDHHVLKAEQKIRGYVTPDREAEMDAVGDICIYLMDFCSQRGYSFEECIRYTWESVRNRDWKERPVTG